MNQLMINYPFKNLYDTDTKAVPRHFQELQSYYNPIKPLGQKVCGVSKGCARERRYCSPCHSYRLAVPLGSAWDLQIAVLFLLVPWELWHALGVRTSPQCTGENLLLKLPDGNTRKAKDDMTWKSRDLGCDATWITAAIESNALLNAIRKQLWTLQHRDLFCSCIGWEACTELDGLELYKQGHCLYKHLWLYCTALPFSMCS